MSILRSKLQKNRSGKVLAVFLVIVAILLITLVAAVLFFFQKEIEQRKLAELRLEKAQSSTQKLESELSTIEKQLILAKEKRAEADERINNLIDELELEKGLREETKNEALSLKDKLEKISKEKDAFKSQLASALADSEKKIAELESRIKTSKEMEDEYVKLKQDVVQLTALQEEKDKLSKKIQTLEKQNRELRTNLLEMEQAKSSVENLRSSVMDKPDVMMKSADKVAVDADITESIVVDPISVTPETQMEDSKTKDVVFKAPGPKKEFELDKIVVFPGQVPEGRILSVDTETEFVIINLGAKDGIEVGYILSVYRGTEYLGDIKITRIQPEMSAADLIPPFSSHKVRKNDKVKAKD